MLSIKSSQSHTNSKKIYPRLTTCGWYGDSPLTRPQLNPNGSSESKPNCAKPQKVPTSGKKQAIPTMLLSGVVAAITGVLTSALSNPRYRRRFAWMREVDRHLPVGQLASRCD
jgi:hypothetical protein